jgi:hypothetical protein
MSPKREQPEIERLNPKLVVRRINLYLPKLGHRDHYVQATIQSLWNHSNGFLLATDLDVGHVHFTVNVSYSQLALDMCCSWGAAKKRVGLLRDKWKLLTFTINNNPKKGNDFIVDYSATDDSANAVRTDFVLDDSATENDLLSYRDHSTQLPRVSDSATLSSPTGSTSVELRTGEERTVQVSSPDEQEREEPNLRGFAPEPPPKGLLAPGPLGRFVPPEVPHSAPPPSAWETQQRESQEEMHRAMAAEHRWEDDKPTSRCRRCPATLGGYYNGLDPEECPGATTKGATV